jgi:hypothetical protein
MEIESIQIENQRKFNQEKSTIHLKTMSKKNNNN